MTMDVGRPPVLFGWRRGATYALLLGTTMGVLDGAAPIGISGSGLGVQQFLFGLPAWALSAVTIVVFTAWAVPRLPLRAMVPSFIVVILAMTALQAAQPRDYVVQTNAGYLGWTLMLYGLLFVGANLLAFRADRTRALLAQAEIARSRSELLFDQAALASLQGVVEPRFVLRVLDHLQRRYTDDAAAADRLLDQLVAFLRQAMPAVRSGHSTLGAELALVRSYLQLCSALDPQRAGWQCEIDGALGDIAFPPLLLLPLLDALAAQTPAASRGLRIEARDAGGTVELRIETATPTGRLPDSLLHRLRVGLQTLHGPAARVGAVPGAPLTIEFPSAGTTPAQPSDPQPSGGPQ
jgi:Histidine kinase